MTPMTQKDLTDIRKWMESGKAQNARFMLVICDTFDWEDYPTYVMPTEDINKKAQQFGGDGNGFSMQTIMECYDLSMDWQKQLNQRRSWNGWGPKISQGTSEGTRKSL